MGEYIKTCIIVEFCIYKSEIPRTGKDPEKVRRELALGVVDNPESFDL